MTNEMHVKSGLASNPNCIKCPAYIEDINHILRACSEANEIWRYF